MDEAHRLRNVYKPGNVIGKALKEALDHAPKVLLTATPLQNTLLELYGLVSLVDERVFGDLASFRDQFSALGHADTLAKLRTRLATVCQRTLRRQVQPYISYIRRIPLVQEFTPSQDEQALHGMVADYLRRDSSHALPAGQRQLISLVLWKLLASSSHAIAGALGTMAERLEGKLRGGDDAELADKLDEDYEALDETEEEWNESDAQAPEELKASLADEAAELRAFQHQAVTIRDNAKGHHRQRRGLRAPHCRDLQELPQPAGDRDLVQQLQQDMSGEINAAMLKTRKLLLENFDEAVQDKLKVRQTESTSARSRFEKLLMDLTHAELQGQATFDAHGFMLAQTTLLLEEADDRGER